MREPVLPLNADIALLDPTPGRATGPLPPGFGPNSLTHLVYIPSLGWPGYLQASHDRWGVSLGALTAQLLVVQF